MKELYHTNDNLKRVLGPHKDVINTDNICGNCSDLRGNAQNLTGNVALIYGDVTGLWGNATDSYAPGSYLYIGDITNAADTYRPPTAEIL